MSHKDDALQEIISLAQRNGVTIGDITQAMAPTPGQAAKESSGVLSKLFGYLGGILIISGICAFVSMYWHDMGSAARVIITLGTGFVAFVIALCSLSQEKYRRAATPLFLIAALFQQGGIFVMLDEYSNGGNWHHGVIFMAVVMLIQQGAAFVAKRRTALAFTSIYFGGVLFATLFDLWGLHDNLNGAVMGVSLICISYALGNSRHAAISGFWYFVGSIILLCAVFDAVEHTPLEIAYLGLTAFLVFLSTYVRSRALLLVSTLAMIWYIGWFTTEHFANTLGWPIALIIGGIGLIGLSAFAVKLNNKYIRQQG